MDSCTPDSDVPARSRPRLEVLGWVLAGLLALIALKLWLPGQGIEPQPAWAQNQPLVGARGVYAFPGQFDDDTYGLFMLDVDAGTIWCYEIEKTGGSRKLRLIAGRTWIYDRYLHDFNVAAPDYRMVRELVAQQRAGAARSENEDNPSPTP